MYAPEQQLDQEIVPQKIHLVIGEGDNRQVGYVFLGNYSKKRNVELYLTR